MTDSAGVHLSNLGVEIDKLCQVELPALLERQIGLLAAWDLLPVLQELNGDVWGVEATDIADQHVWFPILSRVTAVHLHFGVR